jgi:hypothetical protein
MSPHLASVYGITYGVVGIYDVRWKINRYYGVLASVEHMYFSQNQKLCEIRYRLRQTNLIIARDMIQYAGGQN